MDAASTQLGKPVPPTGLPGPFALSDRDQLAALLRGAGLTNLAIEELAVPTLAGSLEEWWTRTCALAGPLATILGSLDPQARDELRRRAHDAASAYGTPGGSLAFPGLTLIASGRSSTKG